MPRVHYVKQARKANPVAQPGEPYYWWKFRYGGKRFSKTYPRASQLTQSDKLSRIYAAQESVEDAGQPPTDARDYDSPAALASALREAYEVWQSAASELQEVADEYEQSADNKEEYFPGTGDEIREKADAVRNSADEAETLADDFERAASDIEELDADDEDWQDEAQNLIDNLPTELEVEMY